jgi:hypothetical protein
LNPHPDHTRQARRVGSCGRHAAPSRTHDAAALRSGVAASGVTRHMSAGSRRLGRFSVPTIP